MVECHILHLTRHPVPAFHAAVDDRADVRVVTVQFKGGGAGEAVLIQGLAVNVKVEAGGLAGVHPQVTVYSQGLGRRIGDAGTTAAGGQIDVRLYHCRGCGAERSGVVDTGGGVEPARGRAVAGDPAGTSHGIVEDQVIDRIITVHLEPDVIHVQHFAGDVDAEQYRLARRHLDVTDDRRTAAGDSFYLDFILVGERIGGFEYVPAGGQK